MPSSIKHLILVPIHSFVLIITAYLALPTQAAPATPLINEFVFDHIGTDNYEYVEILGDPNTDYSSYTVVEVEGDGTGAGLIDDGTFTVGTTDANGYYTTSYQSGAYENGDVTLLLVTGYTGSIGHDIDTNNDGTIDNPVWSAIVDSVASYENEIVYSTVSLTPSYDGGTNQVGGASRIPNGTDTDTINDWVRNDYDGAGIPALDPGTPSSGDALNTPGAANQTVSTPANTTLTKAMAPTAVFTQEIVTVTLVLNNSSTNDEAAISLTDTLPAEMLFNQWITQPAGAIYSNNQISWTGSLSATTAVTFTFQVTNTASTGTITNSASFSTTSQTGDATAIYTAVTPPVINEFVFDLDGSDSYEYVEIFGSPNTDYSSFTVVDIEGDSPHTGLIDDGTFTVGTTDANGYYTTPYRSNVYENGDLTLLLVRDYTGSIGHDIDTNDDGVIDNPAWGSIVDSVASYEDDLVYSPVSLTSNYDGGLSQVGGASRIPNGVDTDSTADWVRNDYDGAGIPPLDPGTIGSGEAYNTPAAANQIYTPTTVITPVAIYTIQGNGAASPYAGNIVTTFGVVTGDFQDEGLTGFYLQDRDGDGDPTTSDGIFVYEGDSVVPTITLQVGDIVTLTGTVIEFGDLTEIKTISAIITSGRTTITPTAVTLPLSETVREQYEAMLITIDEPLYVTDNYELARFGQIQLSENSRLYQYTQQNSPDVTGYANHLSAAAASSIKIDDYQSTQNPETVIYPSPELSAINSVRGGSEVNNLTGVLHYSYGDYVIQPTQPVTFATNNPRTNGVISTTGRIAVGTMNVLNFFTTIDSGSPICGPTADKDCRGADSATELTRQRDKIIQALINMDADVIGLVELENSASNDALQSLIDGLNTILGPNSYAYVATGAIGSDAIRVGFLYRVSTIETAGSYAVLDSSVDATFLDRNRPALAQTFREKSSGELFTAAVNHFKSKGSSCDDVSDPNLDDGAGNCNLTRTNAAAALANWLATDPTSSGDPDFLILGDLNSYAMETPITTLQAAGYTDLAQQFLGNDTYSYLFSGEWGTLDYALANTSLLTQVTSVYEWHINADEPIALDYNTEYKSASQIASFYAATPFRSSDHDPIVIGLTLGPIPPTQTNPITLTGQLTTPETAQFVWNTTVHHSYQLYRSTTPYSGYLYNSTSPTSPIDIPIDTAQNYFYYVVGVWNSTPIDTSNKIGVFTFNLIPGQ